MTQNVAPGCLLQVLGHGCLVEKFWNWPFSPLSLVSFISGGFKMHQREELLFSSLCHSCPFSPGSFFRTNTEKKHERFVGIVLVFLQENLMATVVSFGYSLWVCTLSFQLFENFYFGTLKLNSIHISQRFTVDSFGNYASCGQIDFSWGGSWEVLEVEHPHRVLRENTSVWITEEGGRNLDGDFRGWLPAQTMVSHGCPQSSNCLSVKVAVGTR